MAAYLITHSLLSSWLHLIRENPYEDLTTEGDPLAEFMLVLKREPTPRMDVVLYGRLDALKAGTIYDIKFSKGYERGKFYSSTQHPTYMLLIPEAQTFSYLVSNGMDVWTECYRRDETPDIRPIISDFFDWLDAFGLMDVFKEHWKAL